MWCLAAQLIDSPVHGGPATWLMPMPVLADAAAGVGHVNVQVESDGAARQIAVQMADDAGRDASRPAHRSRQGCRAHAGDRAFTSPVESTAWWASARSP